MGELDVPLNHLPKRGRGHAKAIVDSEESISEPMLPLFPSGTGDAAMQVAGKATLGASAQIMILSMWWLFIFIAGQIQSLFFDD